MHDDEIEHHLRELPAPVLPAAWRESILATAAREATPRPRARETGPAVLVSWRHLVARNPVTVGALAALWLLILVFKNATPVEPVAERFLAQAGTDPTPRLILLREELRFADRGWDVSPAPPLRP
jgi:hypothetical protein